MTKRGLLTITAIAACCMLCAQRSIIRKSTQKAIEAYFAGSIESAEHTAFKCSKSIGIEDIPQARSEIWNHWKSAVAGIEEEKLPPLCNPVSPDTLYWAMPTHPEEGARMPFHYICKGERPSAGYPLFLYMHGSGPKKREWATGLSLCSEFDDAPSAYFIPQIPSEKLYRWAVQPQQWAWEKLLRLALADDGIDARRIYFFGISEGGYGSQRLASFYADYLAGAGPMAGGEPLQNAPAENLANTAFMLRTGAKDYGFGRHYMTYITGKALDSLQAAHPGLYTHNVELIPERGHSIDYRGTTTWLARHKRNPHPTYYYWEDYDMYGCHRKGFYNIRVNETSRNSDEERTCYEVNISGNCIDIKVNNVTYTTVESIQGIPMTFSKSYTPATKGNITLFINEEIIDLTRPVEVRVNGKQQFRGKVKPTLKAMAESCALFFDPERVFPAAIDIAVE